MPTYTVIGIVVIRHFSQQQMMSTEDGGDSSIDTGGWRSGIWIYTANITTEC